MNEVLLETTVQRLHQVAVAYAPACLASSFSAEDMVLLDLIDHHGLNIEVFTLDTGRLPAETYDLIQQVRGRYGLRVAVYFPRPEAVEAYLAAHGPNAFYDELRLRRQCCAMRKTEPLRRALAGRRAWLTGLRREQAPTRGGIGLQGWDAEHGLHKFNPLADWSATDVWAYIRERDVPYNRLYDQGYTSIGCAPCTRAVSVGEDARAGRWWWEAPEHKECGLHQPAPAPQGG